MLYIGIDLGTSAAKLLLVDETPVPITRAEAVEAGTARVVGVETEAIAAAVSHLLDDPAAYRAMAHAQNPYGDGHASRRITGHILEYFNQQ